MKKNKSSKNCINKILFISCFPEKIYNQLIEQNIIYTQAAQKFNKLLVDGICLNNIDVDVLCVVKEPTFNFPNTYTESYKNHNITYSFCNLTSKTLFRFKQKKIFVKNSIHTWAQNNPNGIVILDSLSPIALSVAKQAKKHSLKLIIHVTDFKDLLYQNKGSIKQRILRGYLNRQFYRQFKYASAFLLLTESMKNRIKIKNRPCLIMDGICDYNLTNDQFQSSPQNTKVFLYTGTISYIFGLKNLVEGFIKSDLPNAQLHLYGWGDYVEELKEQIKKHPNIHYFPTIPNNQIVEKQRQATFCVNPRPVADEYTKYSFPSKTIEYLVSARPIITTKLPCITSEYDPLVFWFDDDTVDGIAATLKRCYTIEESILSKKGMMARSYILKEKNNKKQISKLLSLIDQDK